MWLGLLLLLDLLVVLWRGHFGLDPNALDVIRGEGHVSRVLAVTLEVHIFIKKLAAIFALAALAVAHLFLVALQAAHIAEFQPTSLAYFAKKCVLVLRRMLLLRTLLRLGRRL